MYELVTQFSVDQQIQIVNTVGTWLAAIATTAAVVVSLRLAMRAERIASKPRLQFHFNREPADPMYRYIGIEIENVGAGAAYLLPMHFLLDGEAIGTNEVKTMQAMVDHFPNAFNVMAVHSVSVLKAGDRRLIFWIPPERYAWPDFENARAGVDRVNVVIPYVSTHGEVFVAAFRDEFDGDVALMRRRLNIPRRVKLSDHEF